MKPIHDEGDQGWMPSSVRCGADRCGQPDAESGLIHSVQTTAANVQNLTAAAELLHGEETVVYADAGYQGMARVLRWPARRLSVVWPCGQANDARCPTQQREDCST